MKTIFALVAFLLSTAASAACYLIYTPSNELVWRGETSPVPLDAYSIDDEVRKLVPNGHMVISDERATLCPPLNLTSPRKTMKQRAEEMKYEQGRSSTK